MTSSPPRIQRDGITDTLLGLVIEALVMYDTGAVVTDRIEEDWVIG